MSADLTPEQREEMRERHWRLPVHAEWRIQAVPDDECNCGAPWPCDAARLLDALDRAETETERLGGIVVDLEDSEVVPADDWATEVERTREAERQRDDALAALREIEETEWPPGHAVTGANDMRTTARQALERDERSE